MLIDLYKGCGNERERDALLGVVRRELEAFLTRERLYHAAARFFALGYEEALAERQLSEKLGLNLLEGHLTDRYTPAEAMLLVTFDRAGPERRIALLDALRRIQAWDRGKGKDTPKAPAPS